MTLFEISKEEKNLKGVINLTASKSESNRALIIQALCKDEVVISNLAKAQDTETLINALKSKEETIDVGPAGTAMRFLTAYFSCTEGERIITGSERMKQRPIALLVDALRKLGADIEYTEKEGFPPLKIRGKRLIGGKIEIDGRVSSQYISALLLIAPILEKGIQISILGDMISKPYINMTLETMKHFGADLRQERDSITVYPKPYSGSNLVIEADWSAASYWYSIAALSGEVNLVITGLKKNSWQGDSAVARIYEQFGVSTTYMDNKIQLTKSASAKPEESMFHYDFTDCPDIAQTVAATLTGLKIKGHLSGLSSLRIKETDRILALQNELSKAGAVIEINNLHDLLISGYNNGGDKIVFETYEDHRMAMAMAPLALKHKKVLIQEPDVVKKSYPAFWKDLESVGFVVKETNSIEKPVNS